MTHKRVAIGLVLCLLGVALSGLLLLEHHGEGQSIVNAVCGEGPQSGCETVARSPLSKIFGMPWAAVGLLFYLGLGTLLGLAVAAPAGGLRDVAAGVGAALAGAALGIDLALLGLQAFSIKAFCVLCLATYAVNGGLLAVLWPARGALRTARGAVAEASGRLFATAWVVGLVGFGAAVVAAQSALAARAAIRVTTILGSPPPAALPAGSDAARWQAEARRLQETLDDPQKLDQYFADKAAREYETAAVQRFALDDVPNKGAAGAPVQIVEFSDFMCPYCRSIAGAFAGFIPQSGNRVRLYFKNYPLDQACNPAIQASAHAGACWLALGAICAQYQGKFWPYHDRVFSAELHNPQLADAVRLGAAAGLNPDALQSCIQDPRTKERLSAEIAEAQRVGVQSTPTLFVNGRKLPRVNDLVPTVDKEAQAKGFPPFPMK